MINVEINNSQERIQINNKLKKTLQKIVEEACEMENRDSAIVSLALVDDEKIKNLNNKFRNKNESTDVLSFPMDEEIWGDIIISTDKVFVQAEEYGHSVDRELYYLFTHGVLHLLGYNHKSASTKEIMRSKEEKILKKVGLERG